MGKAIVYFLPLADATSVTEQAAAMSHIFEASGAAQIVAPNDLVAIKLHVGEKHNTTHIKPPVIRAVVDGVRSREGLPFLTETSTLYKGERENAVKHLMHAERHGFGFAGVGAPFIMADGLLGNTEVEVSIQGELHQSVKIAREVAAADGLIAVAHPTGHIGAALGATIKTLGMGLASRMGKMRQHSTMFPKVNPEKCKLCKKCLQWCPQGAIAEQGGRAFINSERCIGCGECLAVCRFDAVQYDWQVESGLLQKSMAEHALGVVGPKRGKCMFFNVLVDMTKDCDCFDTDQPKAIADIGILASTDPVAIDAATLDLTAKSNGRDLAVIGHANLDPHIQLEHGAKIGLGSLEYELKTV